MARSAFSSQFANHHSTSLIRLVKYSNGNLYIYGHFYLPSQGSKLGGKIASPIWGFSCNIYCVGCIWDHIGVSVMPSM